MRCLPITALAWMGLVCGAHAADLATPVKPLPSLASPLSGAYLHLGPGGLFLSESAKIDAFGVRVPGATVSAKPQYTAVFELGYYVSPNWAVSLTGGFPPVATFKGAGTLNGLGTLGSVRYGPAVLSAHYHFDFGAFRPYIGAGPTLMIVFDNKDGAMSNVKVDHALGFAGQIGFDYMITESVGVFVDVKKAYLRTTARGVLGGAPIKASVTLDPLVVSTGLTFRF